MTIPSTHPSGATDVGLVYFTDFQARTVEAIAERIIPGDGRDPGATDAGVVSYIDRAVAGFSTQLQPIYRLGLRELERYCERHEEGAFVDLPAERQDEIVRLWLGPEIRDGRGTPARFEDLDADEQRVEPPAGSAAEDLDEPLLRRLFSVVREHTVEGFFCDPAYGGNRGAVAWKLVGFPGAQWGYTAEQMKAGFDSSTILIKTLSDLRRELGTHDNAHYNADEEN